MAESEESSDRIYNHGAFSHNDYGRRLKKIADTMPTNLADPLYLSDLIIQTREIIIPNLENGKTVIQDRYTDSIITYSRAMSRMGISSYDVKPFVDMQLEGGTLLLPKICVYFTADKEILLDRLRREQTPVHRRYLERHELIDYVLEEFEKTLEDMEKDGRRIIRVNSGETSVPETIKLLEHLFKTHSPS
jgi:thymidylate kinase